MGFDATVLKDKLTLKIDDLFGFNLTNKIDGVSYDFGQYKLNKLYKPLVKYFIKSCMSDLEKYSQPDAERVLGYFTDFFSLYFSNGDFGYFKNKFSTYQYRIPYNGKDTEFWRATKDCYYVKTSDVVNDMQVTLGGLFEGKEATIKLYKKTNADKDSDGNDKFVFGCDVNEVTDDESDEVIGYAITFINREESGAKKDSWKTIEEVLATKTIDAKDPQIKKILEQFLKKRGRDYFIHKRLKAFLTEELERYFFQMLKDDIQGKVDIMSLQAKIVEIKQKYSDDPEVVDFKIGQLMKENTPDGNTSVYSIAYLWILNFVNILADLEEFKAKLWNKERKVIQQEYCISLGKIPVEYRNEVVSNEMQKEEWQALGMTAEQDGLFANENTLVVDTKNYTGVIREKLIDLAQSQEIMGRLIRSDNYQALKYLQKEYTNQIKCIYIDPPYNTGSDGFVYKDSYQSASWLSMMNDRLKISSQLLQEDGIVFTSINDHEVTNLRMVFNSIYLPFIAQNIRLKGKEGGNDNDGMGNHHEYILMNGKSNISSTSINLEDKDTSRHIKLLPEENLVLGIEEIHKEGEDFQLINLSKQKDYKVQIPLTDGSILERDSYCPQKTIDKYIKIGKLFVGSKKTPYVKSFLSEEKDGTKPSTIFDQKYGTTKGGGIELRNIFGIKPFSYPKPSLLIEKLVSVGAKNNDFVLDFFAGSGTTGHAVMKLNKEDKGERKFLLVELGQYFNSVLLKRIKKVMYSDNRKDGQATDNDGTQCVVEYLKLNQYENRFDDRGYLSHIAGEINVISDIDTASIGDIKQILQPLFALKERIFGLDDELIK